MLGPHLLLSMPHKGGAVESHIHEDEENWIPYMVAILTIELVLRVELG